MFIFQGSPVSTLTFSQTEMGRQDIEYLTFARLNLASTPGTQLDTLTMDTLLT